MSREKELVKNTVILSIGKFLPKLCSLITLPILTGCLTKAENGTYDTISTLIMLVIPIATLQIQSAAFRFLIDCRDNKEDMSVIITNIFVVTIPVTLLASFIIQFFFAEYDIAVRTLIIFYFVLDTLHLTIGQITRGLGDNKSFSIGAILLSVVYMLSMVLFVYKREEGLLGVMLSLVIAQIIGTLYLVYKTHLFSFISLKNVSLRKIKELLAYSWPMVPNNLSSWVLKLSDRLVITGFLGVESNAVYVIANKIPNILSMAQSVMVMAWQENASIAAKDSDASGYYTIMLDRVFNLMFGCTSLLVAATPILFWLLIKGDYNESYYHMPVLILAMFFYVMSSFFGGIYIAHKKTDNVGVSTMIAAGINLTVDLILIKKIGIWAGSISTLIAYAFLYIYRMINCQNFQKITVNYKKQIILLLIEIVLLIMCFMRNNILNVINCIAAVIIFWMLNRELTVRIIKNVMKRFSSTNM